MSALACILGCSGPTLTAGERAFFEEVKPWGFILFKRNVETPDQVRALTDSLRACVDRPDAPVLIDQEGGRVQRLGPPHWRRYPPGHAYGALAANDPLQQREIARLGARLMAHDLAALGINVDCLPVLDVPDPSGHEVIGDRAYGETVQTVALLGRAAAEGLIAGGVLPVIKHLPGHGRAEIDSHEACPVVASNAAALTATDLPPFQALRHAPFGMTAHVVYPTWDATAPATLSPLVIEHVIRSVIGFDGALLSDDIGMKALSGAIGTRARLAQTAGCDIVLHCSGIAEEMAAVAPAVSALEGRAASRVERALARRSIADPIDPTRLLAELGHLLAGGTPA